MPTMPSTADLTQRAMCAGRPARPVVDLGMLPVHVGALWDTPEAARACPRGPFRLEHCPESGLLRNAAFDETLADYEIAYDNALHHSEVFRRFETALAERLVSRHLADGGRTVEIGAGGGRFLGMLCEMSGGEGLGFDPSHEPAHADPLLAGRATVTPRYFSDDLGGAADLVVMRHVLEHIGDPLAFLERLGGVMGAAGGRSALYVEVPNGLLAIRRLSVWDLIYEHATYFVPASLERMLSLAGFEVLDCGATYDDQFVYAEARPSVDAWRPPSRAAELERLAEDVARFPVRLDGQLDEWRARVRAAADGPVVAWGAGAKAVGFFNLLGISDEVPAVVDVNPRKQGRFLPGTGHPIVAPDALPGLAPGLIAVMNPVYLDEISDQASSLGLDVPVVPVSFAARNR